jgi:hypothetical protein
MASFLWAPPAHPAKPVDHPQNKTGITHNIGKPASLFNDLFPYNVQSLEGAGRGVLAPLVKGTLSGALDLTFALQARGWVGSECQIRSTNCPE